MKDDCVFCKIVKGKLPSTKEIETDKVLAFANIAPIAEHHILIAPKKHIPAVLNIEKDDGHIFLEMLEVVQKLVRKKKIEEGYKLIFNGGKYQAIPHLHWHLLGGELEDKSDLLNQT